MRGRKDYVNSTPKAEILDAYGEIARFTNLPVSGDLKNGYGISPEEVADTIRSPIAAGMVGGSIENQPVSFGMGPTPEPLTLNMLEDVGVRRASIGGGLTRATFGLLENTAEEFVSNGIFGYLSYALSETEVIHMLDGYDAFEKKRLR